MRSQDYLVITSGCEDNLPNMNESNAVFQNLTVRVNIMERCELPHSSQCIVTLKANRNYLNVSIVHSLSADYLKHQAAPGLWLERKQSNTTLFPPLSHSPSVVTQTDLVFLSILKN